jgi:CheY-like chemotaxis protein
LYHIIGNAIKFTEKGFVRLQVRIVEQDAKKYKIHFRISDSGIGIPKELQERIFEPFSESMSRTSRQFHGALGLTIASQLVGLHGCELHLQSREGQGSTFEFELNYPESSIKVEVAPAGAITSLHGIRVLVVEDERLNVLVMQKILSNWGIYSDTAADGQQAINQVIANDYDVILMDINMPVMDGFEASKRIRQLSTPGKSEIPIIAVTASVGEPTEQIRSFPFIDDWLVKPFDPERLREKLVQIAGNIVLR